MNGAAQSEVAGVAQAMASDLAGLDGDGGGAGMTLQALRPLEALALVAHLSQEARSELWPGAGE